MALSFLCSIPMLPQLPGPLLFFLAATSLIRTTASADATNWLFPAYVPNAPPITFESQDTIDASWTSDFVAPVLSMFCQTNNSGDFSISQSFLPASRALSFRGPNCIAITDEAWCCDPQISSLPHLFYQMDHMQFPSIRYKTTIQDVT